MPLVSWLLVAAVLAGSAEGEIDPPSRKQVAMWCRAAQATPEAVRCLDYIYAVANQIDRSRLAMGMPQCIPAAAAPDDLRLLAARALTVKRPGNVDGPAAIVASAMVDAFGCTSDRTRRGVQTIPVGPPVPMN